MRVLVTGATGLIGFETRQELRARGCGQVLGVARHEAPGVLAWDIARTPPPKELEAGSWDVIVHTAASTRWTMTPEDALAANVATVRALRAVSTSETRVVHVSTAYAVGLRDDVASSDLADYRNTYEWSKAQAEYCARETFAHLQIVRPPLTIGRRGDGRAVRFSGMYLLLRGIASSMIPAVVGSEDAFFDVVPVDDVASLVADLVLDSAFEPRPALTIAGGLGAPRVGQVLRVIIDAVNGWRVERGVPAIPPPPLLSPERWERFFLPFVKPRLSARHLRVLEVLRNFEPYLAITNPLEPTHVVRGVEDCLVASVRFWATANAHVASMPPAPWRSM